jgi:PAS domain S-box-containing protein
MRVPELPENEARRVEALRTLNILDSAPEERFDRITRLAARVFGVPISIVSFIDSERQWFKSCFGLAAKQTPRAVSFCGHAILESKPLVVEDAREDPRFHDNPLVLGEPHVRFYAGQPLATFDGQRVGTLCLIDHSPRKLDDGDLRSLQDLASLVENELDRMAAEKLRERALKAQERLHQFFTLSIDMLCIADYKGYFTKLNPAWSETLGYTLEELCQRPFVDFVHPEDKERTAHEAARLIEGGKTVAFENRYRCKDGSYKHILWSAATDKKAHLIYAVARDITGFKQAENELRRATRISEEASRAKSRFLANMSHEFRTPLNSVIGFANVLLDQNVDAPRSEQRTYLERIRDNGTHLLELVNDVLDLSKIEAGRVDLELEKVDLVALASDVVASFTPQARDKSLALGVDAPEGLRPLFTDRQRLKQILINLVANAIKFTDVGHVSVRICAKSDALKPVRVDVADTGIGIPKHRLPEIFDAFKQLDSSKARKHEGTGLGLAISKSLAQRLGYRIEVDSAVGKGTTFRIHLDSKPAAPRGSS